MSYLDDSIDCADDHCPAKHSQKSNQDIRFPTCHNTAIAQEVLAQYELRNANCQNEYGQGCVAQDLAYVPRHAENPATKHPGMYQKAPAGTNRLLGPVTLRRSKDDVIT